MTKVTLANVHNESKTRNTLHSSSKPKAPTFLETRSLNARDSCAVHERALTFPLYASVPNGRNYRSWSTVEVKSLNAEPIHVTYDVALLRFTSQTIP